MTQFTIIVSSDDCNVIYQALGELQLKIALPVFGKLQQQVEQQKTQQQLLADADHAIVS